MSSTEAFSCTAVGSCVFFFFLGGHPWYALSNPFSSAATSTRKPFRGFRQSPLKAQPIKRKNGSLGSVHCWILRALRRVQLHFLGPPSRLVCCPIGYIHALTKHKVTARNECIYVFSCMFVCLLACLPACLPACLKA